jgi:hypothetical protein
MSNVLTDLAADIYKAADIVGREQVGFIPGMTINAGSQGAALNDTVRAAFTEEPTVNTTYAPAMTIPEGNDQTVTNKTLIIDKVANVQIPWTGEDIKHLNNGAGYDTIYGQQIAQAMRKITNTIETYAGGLLKDGVSRAFGTAGTTPFASNFDSIAEVRKILVDNGTPIDGQISLVINSAAGVKLRNLAQLQSVNSAGNEELLRRGTLLDLQGLMLKESAGVASHVKGSATGALVNGALAVGATSIVFDAATAGATGIKAGDVITFAADTANKYVVETGLVASSGTITIQEPGLIVGIADNNAITVGNDYSGNVAFHRAAAELVVRPPAQPVGGDAAVDRMTVQDPFSGLVYEIAVYKGYNKVMFDITTLYGVKVWKGAFVAGLLG